MATVRMSVKDQLRMIDTLPGTLQQFGYIIYKYLNVNIIFINNKQKIIYVHSFSTFILKYCFAFYTLFKK